MNLTAFIVHSVAFTIFMISKIITTGIKFSCVVAYVNMNFNNNLIIPIKRKLQSLKYYKAEFQSIAYIDYIIILRYMWARRCLGCL